MPSPPLQTFSQIQVVPDKGRFYSLSDTGAVGFSCQLILVSFTSSPQFLSFLFSQLLMLMVTNGCAFFSSAHSFLFTMCFLVLSFLLVNLLEVPFYSLLLKSKRLFILMVVGFCLQLIIVSSVSSLPFHFLSLFSLKKYIIIWSFLFGLGSLNLVEIGAKD